MIPQVRQYIDNFLLIANRLNTFPEITTKDRHGEIEGGYITNPLKRVNELIALPGCNAKLIKAAYDYGLLNSVYTLNGEELSSIPELYKAAKSYLHITKSPMIFVRCYTAPGEVTSSEIKQIWN